MKIFHKPYGWVDGRENIGGQGVPEEPIGGAVFGKEAGGMPESHVRGRIREILYYLKSVQDE